MPVKIFISYSSVDRAEALAVRRLLTNRGCTVWLDVFDIRVAADLKRELGEGIGYARQVGFDTILERGVAAAESLPTDVVYAGMSLGAMPAQKLAQTRAGAKGAVLLHAAIPPSEFGGAWPSEVPLQIHLMEEDEFALEGDLDAARELDETVEGAELFLYPGDRHLFTDRSVSDYDENAASVVKQRVIAFLDGID